MRIRPYSLLAIPALIIAISPTAKAVTQEFVNRGKAPVIVVVTCRDGIAYSKVVRPEMREKLDFGSSPAESLTVVWFSYESLDKKIEKFKTVEHPPRTRPLGLEKHYIISDNNIFLAQ